MLAYGTSDGELRIYYDLFSDPIVSSCKQAPITAVAIGSIRNTKDKTLIVGTIDGHIGLYHLEVLEPFFSPDKFKGKPEALGIGSLSEEMANFHPDIEQEFDSALGYNANDSECGTKEELKLSISKYPKVTFDKLLKKRMSMENYASCSIEPHTTQRIQTNISLIKCKSVYLSPLNSVRTEGVFVATADGHLHMYTLDCSPSDVRSCGISYDAKTGEIDVRRKLSADDRVFRLVGVKSWEFTSSIREISFAKIPNPNKEDAKRKRRSNSFHGSVDHSLNDVLICVGLSNQKVSVFPYSAQTAPETALSKMPSEISSLEQQLNTFVTLLEP